MRTSLKTAVLGYALLVGLLIVTPVGFLLFVFGTGALVFLTVLIGLLLK